MPETLVHRLLDFAAKQPSAPALHGLAPDGTPTHWTWGDYGEQVREIAAGLVVLGVESGACVSILASNRPEWVIAEFGIMAANAVPAPMYATLLAEQVAFILNHADAKVVFCDSDAQARKLKAAAGDRPLTLVGLVPLTEPGVVAWDDLRARGRAQLSLAEDRLAQVDPDALGLLIYTSGTTGEPKGVMLRHRGLCVMSDAVLDRFPQIKAGVHYVSYLPLCHVAEQLMTNYLQTTTGGEVTFIDDPKNLRPALEAVRPQVVLGVPRVWEKIQAALEARLREATGIKARLASWALAIELAGFDADVARDDGEVRIGFLRGLARRLVITPILQKLGLDRADVCVTGAAPISESTLRFFASIGLTIYEGYGMTETSGVATSAEYRRPRFGTVGKPLPGVEVKIADDGEILLRGVIMTTGYLHRPQLTAELLDDDDWVHTGDLGSLDAEGNLKITGRKKDILITAGGKNIAPAELEAYIQTVDGIAQAVVVGDRKPYLAALVTLDPEALAAVAKGAGVEEAGAATLAADPRVQAWVQAQVESHCNSKVARVQTVKKTAVLPAEFTVDGGELTPTMKVKRKVVHQRYANEIAKLYTTQQG